MADRLRLALVFHQHQPAGNFPNVFSEVAERAYAPLVAALYKHPEVKATLHFSGPLLDWLEVHGISKGFAKDPDADAVPPIPYDLRKLLFEQGNRFESRIFRKQRYMPPK